MFAQNVKTELIVHGISIWLVEDIWNMILNKKGEKLGLCAMLRSSLVRSLFYKSTLRFGEKLKGKKLRAPKKLEKEPFFKLLRVL